MTNGTKVNLAIPVQAFGLLRYFNITLVLSTLRPGLFWKQVSAGALTLPSILIVAVRDPAENGGMKT